MPMRGMCQGVLGQKSPKSGKRQPAQPAPVPPTSGPAAAHVCDGKTRPSAPRQGFVAGRPALAVFNTHTGWLGVLCSVRQQPRPICIVRRFGASRRGRYSGRSKGTHTARAGARSDNRGQVSRRAAAGSGPNRAVDHHLHQRGPRGARVAASTARPGHLGDCPRTQRNDGGHRHLFAHHRRRRPHRAGLDSRLRLPRANGGREFQLRPGRKHRQDSPSQLLAR